MPILVRSGSIEAKRDTVLAAAAKAGDLIQLPDGMFGIVMGNTDFASGARVSVDMDAEVDIESASGTTFSAGATANFNTSTKLAVTTGGVGGVGVVVAPKVSGQLYVRVRLNRIKVPAAA